MREPRLRTVEKYEPPYPLNKFPHDFATKLGKEIVYHLSTCGKSLEGNDWEQIFAEVIGADWKPSNVGLDDVVFEQCAWGAKTVKHSKPSKANEVRLISGRNSPIYSFRETNISNCEPSKLGEEVLTIWNERVSGVKKKFKHLRTVVLIKSYDLLELAVFEFDTIRYQPEQYSWSWNKDNNLEGRDQAGRHRFTWQPHGSQFTIKEDVPTERLALCVQDPPKLNKDEYLKEIQFNPTWVKILK